MNKMNKIQITGFDNQGKYNLDLTLKSFNQLNITGNVIPHTWYKHITFDSGKPHLLAILILAEIIYWYRPVLEKNSRTGEVLGLRSKFKGDMLQRSIGSFADQFGVSERQVSDALAHLSKVGLIIKESRVLETPYGRFGNQLHIAPIVEKIAEIQSDTPLMQSSVVGVEEVEIDDTPLCNGLHKLMQQNVGAYVNKSSSIYRKETKEETNTENKEAAAQIDSDSIQNESNKNNAAACLFSIKNLTLEDRVINTKLSEKQKNVINVFANSLINESCLKVSVQDLISDIEKTFLNPKEFPNTGSDFIWKLNTIKSSYQKGLWIPPSVIKFQENNYKKLNIKIAELNGRLNEIKSDAKYWDEISKKEEDLVLRDIYMKKRDDYIEEISLIRQELEKYSHINQAERIAS